MISSKITSKGQVTIPKKVREFLNVDTFDNIEFTLLENGKVVVTGRQNSVEALFGMLKHRKPKNGFLLKEWNPSYVNDD